ncbi:glycosyltransferase family 39 protein [Candidatus Sumerlaeota bacterium]|nr:glycosyltransferase family 39 protein [Candidatus Sumerlaeota bacterium]
MARHDDERGVLTESRHPPALAWRWEVALVLFAVLAAALPMVIYPLGRDQSIQAYAGWQYLDGAVPGLDVWDNRPPGSAYLFALAQILFGHTQSSIRWFDLLWTTATALGLAALGRRWFGGAAGLAAAALWVWSYATVYDFWNSAQVDGTLTLPCLGVIALADRGARDRRARWWLAAGVLIAQAFMIKSIVLVIGLPMLTILWTTRADRGLRRGVVVPLLWSALGFALGLAPWVIGLALAGGLGPILDAQRNMNPGYTMLTLSHGIGALLAAAADGVTWFSLMHLPLLALALIGLWALRSVRPETAALVVGWLMAAVIGWIAQMKFYHYHTLPVLAPLALLAGLGADRLVRWVMRSTSSIHRWDSWAVVPLLVAALGVGSLIRWGDQWADLLRVMTPSVTREDVWREMPRDLYRSSCVAANIDMARWLVENSGPDDTFFVWGFEPLIYFEALRPAPTRYIYNIPQVVPWALPKWREELMGDLRASRPLHIVLCRRDAIPWTTGRGKDSVALLRDFPALSELIDRDYEPVWQSDLFIVLLRRP